MRNFDNIDAVIAVGTATVVVVIVILAIVIIAEKLLLYELFKGS